MLSDGKPDSVNGKKVVLTAHRNFDFCLSFICYWIYFPFWIWGLIKKLERKCKHSYLRKLTVRAPLNSVTMGLSFPRIKLSNIVNSHLSSFFSFSFYSFTFPTFLIRKIYERKK